MVLGELGITAAGIGSLWDLRTVTVAPFYQISKTTVTFIVAYVLLLNNIPNVW